MVQTYLRRDAAAQYLRDRYGVYTPETLAKLAHLGAGPKFRKLGRYPLYTPRDLDDWALGRMTEPCLSSNAEASSPSEGDGKC